MVQNFITSYLMDIASRQIEVKTSVFCQRGTLVRCAGVKNVGMKKGMQENRK